jgi:tyrosyl-tRNA synthetase
MAEVKEIEEKIQRGENPMQFKKRLALEVTKFYHGEPSALAAADQFQRVVQNKDYSQLVTEHELNVPKSIIDLLLEISFASSKNEAKRLIDQKAVKFDDTLIGSYDTEINTSGLLKSGKRNLVRIRFS